jgi:diguanylate cyclase (GGDEF)-like protein/PAS domain S-box-containing protein
MSTWLTDRSAFESFFTASPNGIAALDTAGRIIDCNDACSSLSGYAHSRIIGRDIREIAGAALAAFVDEAYEKAPNASSLRRELELKRIDGSTLYVEVTSIPVKDPDSPVHAFLIVEDASERQQLLQNVSAFQQLFEHNPTVVVAVDENRRITEVNPAGLRITGYSREQIIGEDILTFVPVSQRDHLRTFVAQAFRGETVSFPLEVYAADGSVIEYRATALPVISQGRVTGLYGLLQNMTEQLRAERTLAAQREELLDLEHDFRSLFERNPHGMCLLGTDGTVLDVNDAVLPMAGLTREEITGQNFRLFVPPDELERVWAFFRRAIEGASVRYEVATVRADGSPLVLDVTLVPKYAQGVVVGVYCVLEDITERTKAQRKLETQTQRMRDLYLLATAPEYTDAQVMSTLQTGCRMLGIESGAIVDLGDVPKVEMRYDVLELFAGNDDRLLSIAKLVGEQREAVISSMGEEGTDASWIATRLTVGGALQGALVFFSHSRREVPFEEIDHDTLALMSALIGAALERRRTRSRLRTMAYYDALTGLPNRLYFKERLRDSIDDARGRSESLAVLFFDLDRFKDLNDSLGHAMGDRFLQMVAHRLARAIGEGGLVARMGGDEFIVLVRDAQNPAQVAALADRLLQAIDQPYRLDGYEQFITASAGVSIYPAAGRDDQTLIKNADIAMYRAKDRGGNRHSVYDESLEAPLRTRLAQEKDMRRAIERRQFVLHYQPIVDVATDRIVSVEALVRWNHPQRGLISPDTFIPTAEASGLIVPLGEWVIAAGARQIREWKSEIGPLSLAINISARQFHQPDLCERLYELLRECALDPNDVEVEITESMALSDVEQSIETVRKLKGIGAQIAVDDFGTGHSSLNYLRRFAVDHIKIDRSFVAGIGVELSDESIVKAIIAMGHSLELMVVAEGVETREQYEFLRAHGCDRVQGYYFARPLQAEAFTEFFRSRTGTVAQ